MTRHYFFKQPTCTDEQVREAIRAGKTKNAIFAELRVGRQRIDRIAKAMGATFPRIWTRTPDGPRGGRRPHPKADEIVAAYQNGERCKAIIARLGVSSAVVTRTLKNAGIQTRRMTNAEILALLRAGRSAVSIAKAHGVDHRVVARVRDRAGIPVHGNKCFVEATPDELARIRELAPTHTFYQITAATKIGDVRLKRIMAENDIYPLDPPMANSTRRHVENLIRSGFRDPDISMSAKVSVRQVATVRAELATASQRQPSARHVVDRPDLDWMRNGLPFRITVNERGITLPAVGL